MKAKKIALTSLLAFLLIPLNGISSFKNVNALDETLIAHYTFEDESNLGKDVSGNNNNLLTHGSGISKGIHGINFDGNSVLYASYLNNTTSDFVDSLTNNFTISFWGRSEGYQTSYFINTGFSGDGLGITYWDNQNISFRGGTGEDDILTKYTANAWSFYTLVASNSEGKAYLYVDGNLTSTVNRKSESFTMKNNNEFASVFSLGGRSIPNYGGDGWFEMDTHFKGSIADVRIYNKSLTSNEIKDIKNKSNIVSNEPCDNTIKEEIIEDGELIAHYTFEDESNFGKDVSGNNNNLLTHGSGISKGIHGINFDGNSVLYASYLNNTTSDFVDSLTNNFTISFWGRSEGYQTSYFINTGFSGDGLGITYWDNQNISFRGGTGEDDILTKYTANAWSFYTLVASNSEGKAYLYVDGNLTSTVNRKSESFTMKNNNEFASVFSLGGRSIPNYGGDGWFEVDTHFKGSIDDVRVYNKALTSAEIKGVKNESNIVSNEPCDNTLKEEEVSENGKLVAHYEFNSNNPLKDSTNNGFDLDYCKIDNGTVSFNNNEATFNGTNALYVKEDFSDYLSSYTISLWVKCDGSNNPFYIMSTGSYENTFHLSIAYNNLYYNFGPNNKTASIPCEVTNDKFTNIIVSASKELRTVRIYINGEKKVSLNNIDSNNIGLNNDVMALTIGGQADENGTSATAFFTGSIKDVRVYNDMVNNEMINSIYTNSKVNYENILTILNENIDNIVSNTNTIANIINNLTTNIKVKDNHTTYDVDVNYLKETNSEIRAIITKCDANKLLVGRVVTLKYLHKVEFIVSNNGNIKVNGNDKYDNINASYNDLITIEVKANDYYKCDVITVGNNEYEVVDNKVVIPFTYEIINVYFEPITYHVTLNTNGGVLEETTYEFNILNDIDLPTPIKEGNYIFKGWYLNNDYSGDEIKIVSAKEFSDITLYAKWIQIFEIEYDLDGGINNNLNPTTFTSDEKEFELKDATKEGYIFKGWYLDESFTNKILKLNNLTDNTTLYALFEAKEIKVTFVYNNGKKNETKVLKYGDTLNLPNDLTNNGYIFKGWYTDESFTTLYEAYTTLNKDITLYAKWEKEEKQNNGCKGEASSYFILALLGFVMLRKKH